MHTLDSPAFSTLMLLLACSSLAHVNQQSLLSPGDTQLPYNSTMVQQSLSNHVVYCAVVYKICRDSPQLLLNYFCKIRTTIHFCNTFCVWTNMLDYFKKSSKHKVGNGCVFINFNFFSVFVQKCKKKYPPWSIIAYPCDSFAIKTQQQDQVFCCFSPRPLWIQMHFL